MATNPAGGKNRKYGRNKPWCLQYKNGMRRTKNKERNIKRHLKRYPNDVQARKALGA